MSTRVSALPYDVLVDSTGVWYGPSGTGAKSRDWFKHNGPIWEFFSIITNPSFALNVIHWSVKP